MNKSDAPHKSTHLDDARTAHKKGVLLEWVRKYLLKEGNHGLEHELQNGEVSTVDLIEFPLSLLKKIDGPEDHTERESLDTWERRVSQQEEFIKNGKLPAPLIVTDFWRPLEIADGNHRHEALMRSGITKYWTIFFLRNQESKMHIAEHQKDAA